MVKYRSAVFILTYKKEKKKILYLILKRKLHWNGFEFPKGGIEKKELTYQAIKRETKEETGQLPLKIKKFNIHGKYKYTNHLKDRPDCIGQTYTLYSAEIKDKEISFDNKEHNGYKWVDFDTAFKLLTWPDQKVCLVRVNDWLTNKIKIK
jgi:8-oxo-dGTP pyrophosphatase MutT (NUDIX family)